MQKYNISFYNANNNTPTTKITVGKDVQLLQVLDDIKSKKYKDNILKLRSLYTNNKSEYDKQKIFLDAFTPSGTFSKRNSNSLTKHTGLICIDIDNIKDIEDIKNAVSLDKFTLAVFVSPSGAGLKIIVKINENEHLNSFLALKDFYEHSLGVVVDEQCKDVSRLCFVSYDTEIFINEDATIDRKSVV